MKPVQSQNSQGEGKGGCRRRRGRGTEGEILKSKLMSSDIIDGMANKRPELRLSLEIKILALAGLGDNPGNLNKAVNS